ncbi:hypothetical protein [Haloechinothrix sp. LS1_15]|uniref:aa3-type cytochrome oxidase subunit CtaJ n=1 Tax=Haloechinothrix sp. LS1_15 TaxID=2652248 RepID=UPI00294B6832|nr:hypothetical protein [Haloechinothrix sp. LS1_15]
MFDLETILYLVVIPGAIYALITLVTLRSKLVSAPRYRPGQEWNYPPVWWTANSEGVGRPVAGVGSGGRSGEPTRQGKTRERGGARGTW